MTELKPIYFEADGEVHELDVKVKVVDEDNPYDEERGVVETMQQAQQLIRNYSEYALNAFKNFTAAELEEVTLKFGIKMGGKKGVPFVTEGSAEGNLEIEIKCKFPS
ncbi:MAG: CU044_2847 family protein [Xenococcaceae cyanobacterium]